MPYAALFMAILLQAQTPQDRPVWFWFATCGGPEMTLEVRLDKRVLHRSVFPVCRAPRDSASAQGQKGRLELWIKPERAVHWKGYRDGGDRSNPNDVLELDVWQAGADPTSVTLGVSVAGAGRVLINTVHIANPDRRQETAIASGLVVVTDPAKR